MRPRRVTSGTWAGLTAEARADLYASEHVAPAVEALLGTGVELVPGHEQPVRATMSAIVRAAFVAGAEKEVALTMRADHEQRLRLRYARALHEAGLPLPTLTDD